MLHRGDGPIPLSKVFLSGGIAGIVQCSIATPMELLRTKLQVQHDSKRVYRGNLDCIRKVIASEGLSGLYRGNVSMMYREGLAYAIYFSMYEATKRSVCPTLRPEETEPMWVQAVGGAVTGGFMWAAVMPMDVISTRVQALPEKSNREHRMISYIAREIWRLEGISGFYRGLPTAVLRGVILNAIVFPVYETSVKVLNVSRWLPQS